MWYFLFAAFRILYAVYCYCQPTIASVVRTAKLWRVRPTAVGKVKSFGLSAWKSPRNWLRYSHVVLRHLNRIKTKYPKRSLGIITSVRAKLWRDFLASLGAFFVEERAVAVVAWIRFICFVSVVWILDAPFPHSCAQRVDSISLTNVMHCVQETSRFSNLDISIFQ